jgi:hypothetical protein
MFPKFSPSGDKIYCIAGSTTRPYCVIEVHVESKHVVIIRYKLKHHEVDPGYISEPKAVTYPTEDNKFIYLFIYLALPTRAGSPQQLAYANYCGPCTWISVFAKGKITVGC